MTLRSCRSNHELNDKVSMKTLTVTVVNTKHRVINNYKYRKKCSGKSKTTTESSENGATVHSLLWTSAAHHCLVHVSRGAGRLTPPPNFSVTTPMPVVGSQFLRHKSVRYARLSYAGNYIILSLFTFCCTKILHPNVCDARMQVYATIMRYGIITLYMLIDGYVGTASANYFKLMQPINQSVKW